MRSQRLGVRTMRRIDATPALPQTSRAITPLAATMNSSISDVARFFSRLGNADGLIALHHRPRLDGLKIERAMLEAVANHALRRFVLQLELRGKIGAGCHFGRSRAAALKPRAYAVVSQLRAIAHQRAIGLAVRSTRPSSPRQTR